jgi:hypothetical protein
MGELQMKNYLKGAGFWRRFMWSYAFPIAYFYEKRREKKENARHK